MTDNANRRRPGPTDVMEFLQTEVLDMKEKLQLFRQDESDFELVLDTVRRVKKVEDTWRNMEPGGFDMGPGLETADCIEKGLWKVNDEIARAFYNTAFDGNEERLTSLIATGIDLEKRINGLTPLWIAVLKGHEQIVARLIHAGSDVNAADPRGLTPFMAAIMNGSENIALLLLDAGCDVTACDRFGCKPLFVAVGNGYNGLVEILLRRGLTIDEEIIRTAIVLCHVDVFKTLVRNGMNLDLHGESALLLALFKGNHEAVSVLLKAGVRIKGEDLFKLRGALTNVVKFGYSKCLDIILNSNMPSDSLKECNLLDVAAENGQIGIFRRLLLTGAFGVEQYTRAMEKLPFADEIEYYFGNRMTATCALSEVHELASLPALDEIASLPGYGSAASMPNGRAAAVMEFCDHVIADSVEFSGLAFDLTRMRCGSSAEGTKVGLPDEMDYLFQCHVEGGRLDIQDVGHGYKFIYPKLHKSTTPGRIENFISNGSKTFHDTIIQGITKKVKDPAVKEYQSTTTGGGSASSEWTLCWRDGTGNFLDVSVDLVPVLHVDEWPPGAVTRTWLMSENQLRAQGHAYVAKPPSRKSDFGKQYPDTEQQKLWRISFSHLETYHMANLEPRLKDAYIIAKSIRNPDICRILLTNEEGLIFPVDKFLLTYLLKMVFMRNVDEFLRVQPSVAEMVYTVYLQLETCISNWFVPFFWQPRVNVLEGLSLDMAKCQKVARLMKSFVEAWFIRDCETDLAFETRDSGMFDFRPGGLSVTPMNSESEDSESDDLEIGVYSRKRQGNTTYTVYNLD